MIVSRGTPPALVTSRRDVRLIARLADHGARPAVVTADTELTYTQLATRVDQAARRLGTARRLVLIEAANDLDTLVWYLGALAAGNVVLLVPAGAQSLIDAYDPDVVIAARARRRHPDVLDERRTVTAHDLHPDLALLLSTSGSTGSPKLVRLSHDNLQANAESIAEYLGIRETDRAATTLPLYYCYGLSVIHSHLAVGASLVVTDLSVVDTCFWHLVRERGVTTFAGVPHTFDLLDRIGFATMDLPSVRYVTQAGGRMDPATVVRYAELGRRRGFDLVVMYGATEATARMAYLPPDLASMYPGSIGIAAPGGEFTLGPAEDADPDVGELVYRGRNVMLGYAESPTDLGLGRTVSELRTGDLARMNDAGLYEIVGRRSRFVKIVGLRIDLQHVERLLTHDGYDALSAGVDGELHVVIASAPGVDPDQVAVDLTRRLGVPRGSVRVAAVDSLPRLASGKADYPAVRELAATRVAPTGVRTAGAPPRGEAGVAPSGAIAGALSGVQTPGGRPSDALVALYAELLGRGDVTPDSTFVSLGGDSLCYIEMSVRLEQALGHLPANWHVTPIRELVPGPKRRRFSLRAVETGVAVRAAAILMIVGTHIGVFTLRGGAHALLAIAGYNFARFQLTSADRRERLRHQARSIARIVLPSAVFIGAVFLLTSDYSIANVLLVNNIVGPATWTATWQFWFVEVLVQLLVLCAAVLAIPAVDRLERSHQFGFALGLLGIGLVLRYEIIEIGLTHTLPALWLFAFGWALARASAAWHRVLLSAVVLATIPGFFASAERNLMIIGLLLLVTWAATVPVPGIVRQVVSVLASASLYIYLVHWLVYPAVRDVSGWLALVASVLAGIGYWLIWTRVLPGVGRLDRRLSSSKP